MENLRFRDPSIVKRVSEKIHKISRGKDMIKICHVCGTHEWTITHYGIRSLLPENVEVIAGPGCPVCIVPASEIDEAVELALNDVTVTCFGDVLRVPGSEKSLLDAKAEGADVRVVYSVRDAVEMARREKEKEFVFFAVGFETTAPSTAVEILKGLPENMSLLISHRIIPPAMKALVEMEDLNLNGFIAPGHVSTIIGLEPYRIFPSQYNMPTVIAGFEPLDILFGIYMILKQIDDGEPRLENEYVRAVRWNGNVKAKRIMEDVYGVIDGNWRGLGEIPSSKFKIKDEYERFDAHLKYGVKCSGGRDLHPGCRCHLIIIGKIKPTECQLFMKACTPQNPIGPCMVGIEGTCRIWASVEPRS